MEEGRKDLQLQLQGQSEAPVPTGEMLPFQGTSGRRATETNRHLVVECQARDDLQATGKEEKRKGGSWTQTGISVVSITKGVVRRSGTTEIDRIKDTFGRQRSMSIQENKKRKIIDLDTSTDTHEKNENELTAYKKKENIDAFILTEALEATKKLVNELERYIEQNTKREIKVITSKLKAQMMAINSRNVQQWIEENKYDKCEKMVFDADTMTESPNVTSVVTQTIMEEELHEIEETNRYEDYMEVVDRKWPEEIYKNTEVRNGDPTETEHGMVKVVMVRENDKDWTTEVLKQYKVKYPELKRIEEEVSVIKQIYEIKGKREQIVNKIIKIKYKNTGEDLFSKLSQVKENSEEGECLILHEIPSMDPEDLRKMMEMIIYKTKITAKIYIRGQTPKINRNKEKRKERRTYALVVESKGKNYQETMEEVREKLKSSENKAIIGIRKTKEGKVLITMDKDEAEIKKVKEAMEEIEEGKIRIIGNKNTTHTIYIKGLDIFTNQEDVRKAIEREVGEIQEEDIKMSALRPMSNGTRAITVHTTEIMAQKLQEMRSIRVGMVRAGIYRKIEIKKCNRCWKYGHIEQECVGRDNRDCCYKCGESGHQARDCENEEYCLLCSREGHRAGTGRCWVFQKALQDARMEIKNKRESGENIGKEEKGKKEEKEGGEIRNKNV
ncbi:uncharacterized protein PF3D7_1120000-like [Euwallacea similis]|uniref:uncharacterized protein PF3D7_1120000-like n=1 Tax=Euwallacea similis TaxID=1736056 RepID=UPI0034508E65